MSFVTNNYQATDKNLKGFYWCFLSRARRLGRVHEKVQVDGNEPIHHLDSLDNRSVMIIFDLEQSEQKLTFKSASLGLDRCHTHSESQSTSVYIGTESQLFISWHLWLQGYNFCSWHSPDDNRQSGVTSVWRCVCSRVGFQLFSKLIFFI